MKNLIICKNCGKELAVEETVREYNGLDSCSILIVEPCDCWRTKGKKPITITPPRYDGVFFDTIDYIKGEGND